MAVAAFVTTACVTTAVVTAVEAAVAVAVIDTADVAGIGPYSVYDIVHQADTNLLW